MREVCVGALIRLKRHKGKLTRQQFKTLQGQVFAGDPAGAMKGLDKLLQSHLRITVKQKTNVFHGKPVEREERNQ
jgi:hypothetical protein